jgi:hypothetical protein
VASADARRGSWAAQAAIALADRAAARGRCILIDLVIEGGELHEPLKADNTEGIADVFLFGASLRHVVQHPRDHSFEFAAVGAPSDTATVLEHSRWVRLLGEQEREGVTLLLYVASDAPGLEVFSRRVRAAIAIANEEELPALSARIAQPTRLAVIAPPRPEIPASTPVAATPPVERDNKRSKEAFEAIRVPRNAARDALIADLRARQRAALLAPPSGTDTVSAPGAREVGEAPAVDRRRQAPRVRPAPSITEPTFVSGVSREPVKSRRTLYWILSLAVLAAIAVGAWLVIQQQLPGRQTQAPEATDTAPPAVPQVTPQAQASNALIYSVAIEAHQELPLAFERVSALREEEPAMDFYIAPIMSNNVMYYQVMAGPVADSASAGALLLRLLEKGYKTGSQRGEVRRANLAFLLGEYDSRSDADTRESEAAELGIPGYVIEVVQPDETSRYRVYAGAFASPAEAAVMRQLLESVGLPDSLVQRVGKQR